MEKNTWWFKSNSLCLNFNKTHFVVFVAQTKKVVEEEPKISIENRDIARVYKTKFLCVIIDIKLSWRYHIDYMANGISKNIGIIVKVKNILNLKTTKDDKVAYHSETCCKIDFKILSFSLIIQRIRFVIDIWYKQMFFGACSATHLTVVYCLMYLATYLLKYLTFIDIIQDLRALFMWINP